MSAHFVSRMLREPGFEPRIIPAVYVKPFNKGEKNDYTDAEAIAEAAMRPNLRTVAEKGQDQLDLQAMHRVRSRLVTRRTATINQIRTFLIEQDITVRAGRHRLQSSFEAILENRRDEGPQIPPKALLFSAHAVENIRNENALSVKKVAQSEIFWNAVASSNRQTTVDSP